jgi:regulator of CtrA degradation
MEEPMQSRLTSKLVDALYVEAMVLADEARAYFDDHGRTDRELLDPIVRVSFSCESLKVTTRLMHVVAWLLTRRAVEAGEIDMLEARSSSRRLGIAPASEAAAIDQLPASARALVDASADLYARVARLDLEIDREEPMDSPARTLLDRLERSL